MRSVLVLSALLFSSSAALAAPVYDWTGFYIGLNGGFAAGRVDAEPSNDEADHSLFGGMFGVQGGYNLMMENGLVFGFEGTATWNGASGRALVDAAPAPFGNQYEGTDYHWTATLGPKVGFAFDQFVVYGKAGLAMSSFDAYFLDDTGRDTAAQTQAGVLIGVGADYAVTDMISVGGEANFINYGTNPRYNGISTPYSATSSNSTFLLHVNFHPK